MSYYLRENINQHKRFFLFFFKPGFEDESSFDRSPILRYCAVSSIEHSHKTVVSDIMWIPDHMEVINKLNLPE